MEEPSKSVANPWCVESLMAFNFFQCPECEFKNHDMEPFIKHAISAHERALSLLSDKERHRVRSLSYHMINWEYPWPASGGSQEKQPDVIDTEWEEDEPVVTDFPTEPATEPPLKDEKVEPEEAFEKVADAAAVVERKRKRGLSDAKKALGKRVKKKKTVQLSLLKSNGDPAESHDKAPSSSKLGCDHCHEKFEDKFALDNHFVRLTYGNKPKCEPCQIEDFVTLDKFKKHRLSVHGDKAYGRLCGKCPSKTRFISKWKYRAHLEFCGVEDRPVICEVCAATFKTVRRLKQHAMRRHSEELMKKTCNVCGMVTSGIHNLGKHYMSHHPEVDLANELVGEDAAICPECSMLVARKKLAKHRLFVHLVGIEDSEYVCDVCNKRMPSSHHLKEHKVSMHDTVSEHVCEQCSLGFRTRLGLESHMKVRHRAKKKLVCPHCSATLFSDEQYVAHFKEKHPEYHQSTSVECVTCGCVLSSKAALYNHRTRGVCERYVPTDPTTHDCKECGKHFTSFRRLVPHMKLEHPGAKCRYPCPGCGKVLASDSALHLHRKKHCHPKKMSRGGKRGPPKEC